MRIAAPGSQRKRTQSPEPLHVTLSATSENNYQQLEVRSRTIGGHEFQIELWLTPYNHTACLRHNSDDLTGAEDLRKML
jgi:hypothetical protein